jgi:hypothetical protein
MEALSDVHAGAPPEPPVPAAALSGEPEPAVEPPAPDIPPLEESSGIVHALQTPPSIKPASKAIEDNRSVIMGTPPEQSFPQHAIAGIAPGDFQISDEPDTQMAPVGVIWQ